jgi:hypothetical protein
VGVGSFPRGLGTSRGNLNLTMDVKRGEEKVTFCGNPFPVAMMKTSELEVTEYARCDHREV